MSRVKLTGEVVEPNEPRTQTVTIRPDQVDEYEEKGWIVSGIKSDDGVFAMFVEEHHPDGVVEISPQLDAAGRAAVRGRNANYGYSGYFAGYVYQGGQRRVIKGWRDLFPNAENRYAQQGDKGQAIEAIRKIIADKAGAELVKVKGGYAFTAE